MSIMLFLGGLLGVAHAGGACVPPPQAIGAEQRTRVDAAFQARVASLAGGAGVDKGKSYETVVLSQNALEKAWLLYVLCRGAERGEVSAQAYEAERRFLLGMPATPATTAAEVAPVVAPVTTPAESAKVAAKDFLGTWYVDVVMHDSTCPPDVVAPGEQKISYVWEVSPADDLLAVSVQSKGTSFSLMYAAPMVHGGIEVFGQQDNNGSGSAWFRLKVEGERIEGERIVTLAYDGPTYTANPGAFTWDAAKTVTRTCMVMGTASGKRLK